MTDLDDFLPSSCMTDFCHIPARQDAINLRLEHWALWVRVRPQAWKTAPMFRLYRAPRQYAYETADIKVELNTLECHEIERAVSILPDKHRAAIRWAYVFPMIHRGVIRRKLEITDDGLVSLVVDGRDMLKNRLREKIVDRT